jgi:hypothetical protein
MAMGPLLPRTVLQYAVASTPDTPGSGLARRVVLVTPPGARCLVDELSRIVPPLCRKSKRRSGIGVESDGRIVMHDEEEGNPPPADDNSPPSSSGEQPPTGPSGPPDDLLRKTSRDTYYVEDGNYYFDAKLDRYGTVHLNVKTKIDGVYGKIHAEVEFKNMLDHFGRSRVQAIRGAWDAQAPGLTGNIELFNKLTAGGMSPQEAAFKIPTGRWAKEAGYDKIKSL